MLVFVSLLVARSFVARVVVVRPSLPIVTASVNDRFRDAQTSHGCSCGVVAKRLARRSRCDARIRERRCFRADPIAPPKRRSACKKKNRPMEKLIFHAPRDDDDDDGTHKKQHEHSTKKKNKPPITSDRRHADVPSTTDILPHRWRTTTIRDVACSPLDGASDDALGFVRAFFLPKTPIRRQPSACRCRRRRRRRRRRVVRSRCCSLFVLLVRCSRCCSLFALFALFALFGTVIRLVVGLSRS